MAKSTSVPIYSLPNTNGLTLPPEDDWTRAKDRREKKRIQNRVAQRTYRQRMKARLGELQARVDYHEERSATLQRTESNDASRSASVETRSASPASTQALPATTSTTSPLPNPPDQAVPQAQQHFNSSRAEANNHDGLFLPSAQLFDSSLFRQTSPQASNDRPPQTLSDMPNQEPNLSSEFMQECLRFQMQLLNKITPPEDSAFSGFFDEKDDMSLTTLGSHDGWKQVDISHEAVHPSPISMDISTPPNPLAPQQPPQPALPPAAAATTTTPLPPPPASPTPSAPHPPSKNAPLDERIEYVLECAQSAGFDSFDALAASYYTGAFGDASLLAAEQRLSRHRRLAKLLAELFDAARAWSAWERRGFHEEILQSAESMLVAECAGFAAALDAAGGGGAGLLHDHGAVKRLFQNEMPNLGALMTALAAENTAVRHRDRPSAVMATILVLCFTGRVSSSQLDTVLSSCLEGLGCGK